VAARSSSATGGTSDGALGSNGRVCERAVGTGAETLGGKGIPPFHGAGRWHGCSRAWSSGHNALGHRVGGGGDCLGAAIASGPRTGNKVTGLQNTLVGASSLGIIHSVADLLTNRRKIALHIGLIDHLTVGHWVLHPLEQLLVGHEPNIWLGDRGEKFVVEIRRVSDMNRMEIDTKRCTVAIVMTVKV